MKMVNSSRQNSNAGRPVKTYRRHRRQHHNAVSMPLLSSMMVMAMAVVPIMILPRSSHALLNAKLVSVHLSSTANSCERRTRFLLKGMVDDSYYESNDHDNDSSKNIEAAFPPSRRRNFLRSMMMTAAVAAATATSAPQTVMARNLPTSTGADTSQVGTMQALIPIVELRESLSSLLQLTKATTANKPSKDQPQQFMTKSKGILSKIPKDEILFKRLFDTYSNQVSYKQQFLDSNAFLVYYTQGFDGPNRPNIEREQQTGSGSGSDVVNEKQTLQYGLRNDAWIAYENCLIEYKYLFDSDDESNDGMDDFVKYIAETLQAVDSYLSLAPQQDVQDAKKQVSSF